MQEWRSQQLASGGALENANFQPLGTLDWRERVKRAKKAENKAESKADSKADKDAGASTKPTAAVVAGVANGEMQKRPDLKELSKDLPSGWQVLLTRETGLCHNLILCELSSWGNVLHQAVQWTLQSHCPFSFTSLGYGSVNLVWKVTHGS
jgi:hypothetical protein